MKAMTAPTTPSSTDLASTRSLSVALILLAVLAVACAEETPSAEHTRTQPAPVNTVGGTVDPLPANPDPVAQPGPKEHPVAQPGPKEHPHDSVAEVARSEEHTSELQ